MEHFKQVDKDWFLRGLNLSKTGNIESELDFAEVDIELLKSSIESDISVLASKCLKDCNITCSANIGQPNEYGFPTELVVRLSLDNQTFVITMDKDGVFDYDIFKNYEYFMEKEIFSQVLDFYGQLIVLLANKIYLPNPQFQRICLNTADMEDMMVETILDSALCTYMVKETIEEKDFSLISTYTSRARYNANKPIVSF